MQCRRMTSASAIPTLTDAQAARVLARLSSADPYRPRAPDWVKPASSATREQPVPARPGDYTTFSLGADRLGGMGGMKGAPARTRPWWLAHFAVTDTNAAVGVACTAGGTLLSGPDDTPFGSAGWRSSTTRTAPASPSSRGPHRGPTYHEEGAVRAGHRPIPGTCQRRPARRLLPGC